MATYTNHSQHTHDEPVQVEDNGQVRESTSPMLVGALAMALVALGVWWYAQRDDAGIGTAAPSVTVIEPPAAATTSTDARPVASTANRAERTRPVVIADRAPQPLAGNPIPDYPRNLLRAGEEGAVMLRIAVNAQGVPTDVQVVERSGHRDRSFDRAAIEAAQQWRFQPAMRDGKAVSSTVQLPVDFRRG